jgi:endonuclease/exonuclease/phosphatase (EEP) superfamily protein YafD
MRIPLTRTFVALSYLYLVCLFAWLVLQTLFNDRWWWMFLLNSFAVYLFLPAFIVLPFGILARKRLLWMGASVVLLPGFMMYGELLLPPGSQAQASGTTLTVMTYNVLGYNTNSKGVVEAIRQSGADVVALQELNPLIANAIQNDLSQQYPYQDLSPVDGTSGAGIISRYPMQPVDTVDAQIGGPLSRSTYQLASVEFEGNTVLVLRVHAVPPRLGLPSMMNEFRRLREHQATAIAKFASKSSLPLVVAGDFNATEMSTMYDILSTQLHDAWREAGWGLGHTFPGGTSSGTSRIHVAGVYVPSWLVRIDYVFHTEEWRTLSAQVGPWDGESDHRPVVATLQLQQ